MQTAKTPKNFSLYFFIWFYLSVRFDLKNTPPEKPTAFSAKIEACAYLLLTSSPPQSLLLCGQLPPYLAEMRLRAVNKTARAILS
jgi:hypothetical protein